MQLGADITDISSIIGSIDGAVDAVVAIVQDPYFAPTVIKILELRDIASAQAGGSGAGIGLQSLQTPLDIFITFRKNPWMPYAAAFTVLAIPFFIGVAVGRRR